MKLYYWRNTAGYVDTDIDGILFFIGGNTALICLEIL